MPWHPSEGWNNVREYQAWRLWKHRQIRAGVRYWRRQPAWLRRLARWLWPAQRFHGAAD